HVDKSTPLSIGLLFTINDTHVESNQFRNDPHEAFGIQFLRRRRSGVGFRRGGGGGSPRVGSPWPARVGFGPGVWRRSSGWSGGLAGVCTFPVLETRVVRSVDKGWAAAPCVLLRGRDSGFCEATAAERQRHRQVCVCKID